MTEEEEEECVNCLLSDGIFDKGNHPQLKDRKMITIALQIQMRHRKKKKRKRKKARILSVLFVILTSQTN